MPWSLPGSRTEPDGTRWLGRCLVASIAFYSFLVAKTGAQTNDLHKLFRSHAGLERLFDSPPDALPVPGLCLTDCLTSSLTGQVLVSVAKVGVFEASGLPVGLQSTNQIPFTQGKRWEVFLYHITTDKRRGQAAGLPLSQKLDTRPSLARFVKSIPMNFLNTFNTHDPVPVDYGPAPSTLPLHFQPRPRSQSEPPDPPMIIFGGKPP